MKTKRESSSQKSESRILHLTLKRKWFDLIASGEKKEEYRREGRWILSRLEGKSYDIVRFRNGYASNAPVVDVEFKGWKIGSGKPQWGGGKNQVIICLGNILNSGF